MKLIIVNNTRNLLEKREKAMFTNQELSRVKNLSFTV